MLVLEMKLPVTLSMARVSLIPKIATNGVSYVIETAKPDCAEELLNFIRREAVLTDQILTQADECPATVEDEREFLQAALDKPADLFIVAKAQDNIIASLNFQQGRRRRNAHTGEFGMLTAESWRRKGVGEAMLHTLLDWAKTTDPICKVCLSVFATNTAAIGLYRKLGFEEEGRQPKHYLVSDSYVDGVLMFKWVG